MGEKHKEIDMSPRAVTARLKEISDLYQLWLKLREAKYLGKVAENQNKR